MALPCVTYGLMPSADELITIGKVLKPYGVKGEVRIQSLTDVPGRFEGLSDVTLVTRLGKTVTMVVTQVRVDGRSYLFKFATIDTPEDVKAYQGAWMMISRSPVPALPGGSYYQFELIGLQVDDESGKFLGILEEVLDLPAHPVFVVRMGAQEWLIPALRRVVIDVDMQKKLMTVTSLDSWMII